MSRLAKRVLTGASLAVATALLLVADDRVGAGWVPLVCAAALSLLASWELGRMVPRMPRMPGEPDPSGVTATMPLAPFVALVSIATGAWTWSRLANDSASLRETPPATLILVMALPAVAVFLALAVLTRFAGRRVPRAVSLLLALWVVPPLYALVPFGLKYGTQGLVVLVLLSKIGDIFGYFVGRAIGKRHPFPNLSPGKTVAGCVASLVAGVVAGGALALPSIGYAPGWLPGCLLGAGVNLAAQAGDLLESYVKRQTGVKDSSSLVGPAGGVLDVVDSLLLTAPVGLLLWPLL